MLFLVRFFFKIFKSFPFSHMARPAPRPPPPKKNFFLGSIDLDRLFSRITYPKLKLLLLENCELVLSQVKSLAAFKSAGAASSSSSGGGAIAGELVARFFSGSKQFVRLHLHGCRFEKIDGSFVEASAETLPSLTGLTADAARAAAFLQGLASSVSSSSSSSPPEGGGGGGGKKRTTSQKKGGGSSGGSPPPPPTFKGLCFGCDAWGNWDDFGDEMDFAREKMFSPYFY